jgi:hypothetical protein
MNRAGSYDEAMTTRGDAEAYLAQLSPLIQGLATEVHQTLVSLGCASYVKTIYVGYDLDGEMVAAMYGHADRVEVALALAEDAEDELLTDASHLTWRTLPLAAVIIDQRQLQGFRNLAVTACGRVQNRSHDVYRANDYFARRREERRCIVDP